MLVKSDYDAFLKEYWDDGKREVLVYQYRPLLAMVPKDEDAGGENWVIPIDLDWGADGGPTFSDAQAIAQASGTDQQAKQFVVQWQEDFQLAQLRNAVARVSRKSPQLALEKAANLTKKKQDILAARIARNMYKSGYNDIGTVDSSVSALNTKTIGLSQAIDARNFHIGQRVVFASSLTAALRDSGDFVSIVAIDYDNKKILTDAPTDLQTSITGIQTGDKIFIKGGRGTGATPTLLAFQGLPGWIPDTAPTSGDSFNGQDRSVWADRMAGLRYPASGTISGPVLEIMIDSLVDAAIREVYPNRSFIDPKKYGEAVKVLEGTRSRVDANVTVGRVGFKGVELQVGYNSEGSKLFPDANCPTNYAYNLTIDTWKMPTLGPLIQNDLIDGEARDVENASAVEYRYVFHGAFGTDAPGKNQVVKFA